MALGFAPSFLDKKKNQKNLSSNNIRFLKNSFLNHFENLSDPRTGKRKDHLLIDIVATSAKLVAFGTAILAVISGADNWNAIETYGQAKEEWLSSFLKLPNGIPSHETISWIFQRLNPEEFAASFTNWINLIVKKLGAEIIAIDGKTIKQSYDRNDFKKALHIVSAWANNNKLVLGQKKVDSKSNERTAIPILLKSLEVSGNIIAIDALETPKEIAKLIINKKADYILALKGNKGKLHKQVKDCLKNAKNSNFSGIQYSYFEQIEAGHHRIEKREVYSVAVTELGTCALLKYQPFT